MALTKVPFTMIDQTDTAENANVLVNLGERTSATGSVKVPSGTTAERDGSPVAGYLRHNTTLAQSEIYNGSAWVGITADTDPTGSTIVRAGTTAQRDGSPAAGYFRFNSTNVQFEGYDGSSWTGVGGASGGGGNPFVYENDTNVIADYTITTGKNAMSAGPITIDSGFTVTVPSGSVYTIV